MSDASKIGPAVFSHSLSESFVCRERRAGAGREPPRDLERAVLELLLGHAEGDESDALRLDAVDLLAEQQVVLRLRHPAEERPDDRGVVARGDAELRVAVDDARLRRRERDVREQADDESRADRGAGDRGDDRRRAGEHVVDEVARLVEDALPRLLVVGDAEHEVEVAARAERAVGAADEHGARLVVVADRVPHARELAVLHLAHGVEPTGRAEREPQDPVLEPLDVERRELRLVREGHESDPTVPVTLALQRAGSSVGRAADF